MRPSPGHLSPTGEAGRLPGPRQGRAWQAVCYPPSSAIGRQEWPSSRLFPSVLEGHDLLGQRQQSWNSNPVPPPSSRHPHPLVPRWPRCGTQASPALAEQGTRHQSCKPEALPSQPVTHSLGGTQRKDSHPGTREPVCPQPLRSLGFLYLSNGNQNNGPGVLLTIARDLCLSGLFFFFFLLLFLVSSTEILVP